MAKRYQLTTKRSGVKEITYSLDDMETPFRLPWATTSLAEIEQLIALDDEIRIDGRKKPLNSNNVTDTLNLKAHSWDKLNSEEFAEQQLQNAFTNNVTLPSMYISQLLSHELSLQMYNVITRLHEYEMRVRNKNPTRAKSRLRLLTGLREASSALAKGKVKLLLVPTDIEASVTQSDEWQELMTMAKENLVPHAFGLTRRQMTEALGRRGCTTSIVTIINCDGAHQECTQVAIKALELGNSWTETMIQMTASELSEGRGDCLHSLCFHNHINVLKGLYQKFQDLFIASIDFMSCITGWTPIMAACSNFKVFTFLLDAGARLDLKDFTGNNMCHYMAMGGVEIEKFIEKIKALNLEHLFKERNNEMEDPLCIAIKYGNISSCQIFLDSIDETRYIHVNYYLNSTLNDNAIFKKTLSKLPKSHWNDDWCQSILFRLAPIDSIEYLRVVLNMMTAKLDSHDKISSIINGKNVLGKSAVWESAYVGSIGSARELLSRGASLDDSALINGKEVAVSQLLDNWKNMKKS